MTDEASETGPVDRVAVGEARARAVELLASQAVGLLAVTDDDGPYAIPISYVYDGEEIFWHGSRGKMSRALDADPRACLAVMEGSTLVEGDTPCAHNVRSRSTLVFGLVSLVDSGLEKDAALRTIIAKYDSKAVAAALEPEAVARTLVFRMEVRAITYRELPS